MPWGLVARRIVAPNIQKQMLPTFHCFKLLQEQMRIDHRLNAKDKCELYLLVCPWALIPTISYNRDSINWNRIAWEYEPNLFIHQRIKYVLMDSLYFLYSPLRFLCIAFRIFWMSMNIFFSTDDCYQEIGAKVI